MNCPKCNVENEANSKYCKNCGWDLTIINLPDKNETLKLIGIIALMFPIMDFIGKFIINYFL